MGTWFKRPVYCKCIVNFGTKNLLREEIGMVSTIYSSQHSCGPLVLFTPDRPILKTIMTSVYKQADISIRTLWLLFKTTSTTHNFNFITCSLSPNWYWFLTTLIPIEFSVVFLSSLPHDAVLKTSNSWYWTVDKNTWVGRFFFLNQVIFCRNICVVLVQEDI